MEMSLEYVKGLVKAQAKSVIGLLYMLGQAVEYASQFAEKADRDSLSAYITSQHGKSYGKTYQAEARRIYNALPSKGFSESLRFSAAALSALVGQTKDWLPSKRQSLMIALSAAKGLTAELVPDVIRILPE